MMKSYRYKLFRNRKKAKKLQNELWQFHLIFNHSIRLIKTHYKVYGKNPSKNELQKHLKKLMDRGERPEWKLLGYSQGIQEVTDRIYKSYDAFFKWTNKRSGDRKSPPKFRPFRKYKSFTLKQAGWELDEEKGQVRIGKTWYRYIKSRNIIGNPKTITIKRDPVGDWYISISCELDKAFVPEKVKPMTGKSAGFDFGLKTFLTASDESKLESGEFLKHSLTDLRKSNQSLSRKKKGSKNRKKAKKNLARVHRSIANKRKDAHFKMALQIVQQYDHIFFENLTMQGMKKLWGRKVSDYGFGDFLRILEFKAVEHKKTLFKVGRFYPSSKLCSSCGVIKTKNELTLAQRVFECDCGFVMDRDLNAAINILREGASSLRLDGIIHDLGHVSVD